MEAPIKTRRRPGTCFLRRGTRDSHTRSRKDDTVVSTDGQRRHSSHFQFSRGVRAKHSARRHCHSPACVKCPAASRFVMVPRYANQIFHTTFVLFNSIKSQVRNRLVPDTAWLN